MIQLKNVCKTYHLNGQTITALRDLTLNIKNGTLTAVVGPSGSGKSTLLHLIGGLDKPSSGQIFYKGKNLNDFSDAELADYRHREVGLVFQDFYLYEAATVEANVSLPRHFGTTQNLPSSQSLLKKVKLWSRHLHYPHQLSGGEKQRTAIARAISMQPPLLLADEPTGNLDDQTGADIIKLLKEVHDEQKSTLIIATHDASIAKIADRIIELKEGRMVVS